MALTVTPLRAVSRDGWQKGTDARRDGRMNDRREGGGEGGGRGGYAFVIRALTSVNLIKACV